jgi:kynurenine 3-monooxygenase
MRSVADPRREPGDSIDLSFEAAVDSKDDALLTFLDIDRFDGQQLSQSLRGLRTLVIGAGPAGLVFARAAAAHGADVTVLERTCDPRRTGNGYTDRSYNLTLDNVGRQVLGDTRAYKGGIWLTGRAIHAVEHIEQVTYGQYGHSLEAAYVSVPRPVLRQNLTVLAEEQGASFIFDAFVAQADVASGEVTYTDSSGDRHTLSGDLLLFGDGLHSLINKGHPVSMSFELDEKSYFAGLIPAEASAGLSLKHIHLWHEPGNMGYTFGIPNADGTIALLTASAFADLTADAHPFSTEQQARERLRRDFPSLYTQAPFIAEQFPKRHRGRLWYKSVNQYRVGGKGVVIGEAACSIPYWAGYGANAAMYAAASLAFQLAKRPENIDLGLEIYERQQLALVQSLMNFVRDQGNFLSTSELSQNPSGRSDDALAAIIQAARLGRGGGAAARRVSTYA